MVLILPSISVPPHANIIAQLLLLKGWRKVLGERSSSRQFGNCRTRWIAVPLVPGLSLLGEQGGSLWFPLPSVDHLKGETWR